MVTWILGHLRAMTAHVGPPYNTPVGFFYMFPVIDRRLTDVTSTNYMHMLGLLDPMSTMYSLQQIFETLTGAMSLKRRVKERS